MTRARRVVAAVLLAGIAVLVAGAVVGAAEVAVTIGALAGLPWSLAAVAVALGDRPDAVAYALGAAAALLNVVLVTLLARRLTR